MIRDVVDALRFVQSGLHPVFVRLIPNFELDVVDMALAVVEFLEQIEAVGVEVAVVLKGVEIGHVCAPPLERDGIRIAVIAVDHIGGRVDRCRVGDPHRAVAVAAVKARAEVVYGVAVVDFIEAGFGHCDGHRRGVIVGCTVGDVKLAVRLCPLGDLVLAGGIHVPFDSHILLVVLDALRERVHIGVGRERRRIRGDRRQGGDDLVVYNVAVRAGAGVGIAVRDVVCGAVVLAGVCL